MKIPAIVQGIFAALFALQSVAANTIVDIAANDLETFGTLVTALDAANLVGTLADEQGSFTVFAPTNDAFADLPGGSIPFLVDPANIDTLTAILTYHVALGEAFSSDLSDGLNVVTLSNDETVEIRIRHHWSWHHWDWVREIFVNDSRVIVADVDASNGVIHVIDQVLVPPSITLPQDILGAAESAGLNTLLAAVEAAGLEDLLGGDGSFTVFAPSDEAFAQIDDATLNFLLRNPDILTEVLAFHVLEVEVFSTDVTAPTVVPTLGGLNLQASPLGDTVLLESTDTPVSTSAQVVVKDVNVLNGVVHVIDTVLIPPGLTIPGDIAALAIGNPDLSELVGALGQSPDLLAKLQEPGPYTVFAPTNAAFAALTEVPTGDALTNVLEYHVLDGYVTAEDIIHAAPAVGRTLNGRYITATVSDDGNVFINDAMVTNPNVIAFNGIIHVVDEVLIPPSCPYRWSWLCDWFGGH